MENRNNTRYLGGRAAKVSNRSADMNFDNKHRVNIMIMC